MTISFWQTTRRRFRRPFFRRLWSYINWHWSRRKRKLRLVFVKTKFGIEPIRNYLEDRKWGGWCGGTFETSFGHKGVYGTSNVDYSMLPKLFDERNGVVITPEDVLVDVGCGRGRVINYWLSLGLGNRIYGIELERRWATEAARRLAPYPSVTIVHGDVLENIPPDGTIFYIFNPFGRTVMEQFADRLLEVCGENAPITLVYYFSLWGEVFEQDPRWVAEPVRTKTFHPSLIVRPRAAPTPENALSKPNQDLLTDGLGHQMKLPQRPVVPRHASD